MLPVAFKIKKDAAHFIAVEMQGVMDSKVLQVVCRNSRDTASIGLLQHRMSATPFALGRQSSRGAEWADDGATHGTT